MHIYVLSIVKTSRQKKPQDSMNSVGLDYNAGIEGFLVQYLAVEGSADPLL